MLPQVNAQLLAISSTAQSSEDWDKPAGSAGSLVWSGHDDAYVIEKVRSVYAGREGGLIKQKDVVIIIPSNLVNGSNESLTLQTGQIVTYIYRGTTYKRRIMDYSAPHILGANIAEYVRLDMDPEPLELELEEE